MIYPSFFKNKKIILLGAFFIVVFSIIFLVFPRQTKAAYVEEKTDQCSTEDARCYLKNGFPGYCWEKSESGTSTKAWFCVPTTNLKTGDFLQCSDPNNEGKVCGLNNNTWQISKCKSGNCETTEETFSRNAYKGESKGEGNVILDWTYKAGIKLVTTVVYTIHKVCGWFLWIGAQLLGFVLSDQELQKFTTAGIVVKGWTITRDLSNMFFALALMIISVSTILGLENYGAKKTIVRLIIAALLINFSLVIAGVIIDFTQVLTKYFVDGSGGTNVSSVIMDGLHIGPTLFDSKNIPAMNEEIPGLINLFITLVGGIILILLAAFTFLAAAILLIVRFVALWFLLILAPLAWLFLVLPATRNLWSMWWRNFFKWAFFAPAYTFFLWLAIFIINSKAIAEQAGFSEEQLATISNQSFFGQIQSTADSGLALIIDFVIIIGFLLGGLIVAQKLGVYGSSALYNVTKRTGKTALRATERWAARGAPTPSVVAPVLRAVGLQKAAAGWEKVSRVAGAPKRVIAPLFSPEVWKRAVAARKARGEAFSFSQAAGRLEGLMGLSINEAKMKAEKARAAEVGKKQEEFSKAYKDEDRLVDAYKKAKDPIEKEALLRNITSINGINTLFASMKKDFGPLNFKNYLKEAFASDEEAGRIAADLGAMAAANGNFSLVGAGKWDEKKQVYRTTSDQEQLGTIATKIKEWEPQDLARRVHPDSFFKIERIDKRTGKSADDTTPKEFIEMRRGGLHEGGAEIVNNLTINHAEQVSRIQGRTLEAIYNKQDELKNVAKPERKEAVEYFVHRIKQRYEGKGIKDFDDWKKNQQGGTAAPSSTP